jgi:hypothetical protein
MPASILRHGMGVYHVPAAARRNRALLGSSTGKDRVIGTLEGPLSPGLTVSVDGKTILFTKVVGSGSDLMLIENFR